MGNARGSGSGSTTTADDGSNSAPKASLQASGSGSGTISGSSGCNFATYVWFGDTQSVDVPEENGCSASGVTISIYVGNPGSCPVSVNYSTQDSSATAGTDYTATSGTASFPAYSQGPYSFTIPILDDGNDETGGTQSFYVVLSNPVHATLGNPSSFTVNITEATPQGSTDTLVWNSCPNNYASDPLNWYDQTIGQQLQDGDPGPTPDSTIIFDGTPNSQTSQNAPITWDSDAKIGTMEINNGYDSEQTLTTDAEETGAGTGASLSMDGNANDELYLYFNPGETIKADKDQTITKMTLAGDPTGTYEIAGGTTSIAGSPGFQERTGVNITIDKGATLLDYSFNSLQFTNSGLSINVYGTMNLAYGTGTGATLIDNNGYRNNYINVNGGTLLYAGAGGVTDTFTVPVYVQGGGTFRVSVSVSAQNPGGKLIVQNLSGYAFPNGSKNSVYMTGASSSVQLAKSDTLECANGYYQASGILETTDTTPCTLKDDSGTTTIASGSLKINQPNTGGYGELDLTTTNLQFGGQLVVAIQVYDPKTGQPQQDFLHVSGTTSLNPGCTLVVYVNNAPPNNGSKWIIIKDDVGNITGDFVKPITTNPQTNLNSGVDPTNKTQYVLSF